MDVLGIHLGAIDPVTFRKVLLTAAALVALLVVRLLLVGALRLVTGKNANERVVFWTRQATSLIVAVLLAVAVFAIWVDHPGRAATGLGLITAGLAVALQKVWTSFAGYLVILRGKTFSVGDRIVMGGVRGDVIALGFLQTRVLEMGQPPGEQADDPSLWVHARQYTGRVVSITNDKVFDTPVYNYSREFPFLFDEIAVPIKYEADHERAERILIEATERATADILANAEEVRAAMEAKYFVDFDQVKPRVYVRLTDNWIELAVRFVVRAHGIREVKDRIAREVLARFREAGLEIASATFAVVGAPRLAVTVAHAHRDADAPRRPSANGSASC